jgi:hypothetical protein
MVLPMRPVALAGLMAALAVRVSLAQRLPPLFPSYFAPVTDARIQPPAAQPKNSSRLWIVGGLHVVGWAIVYVEAQRTWGHSRGRFHVKDDWTGDSLSQNDEASHMFFGFTLTRNFSGHWRWGGMSPRGSRTAGATESAVALTLVEVMDAFNPAQGLGISDLAFDYAGVGAGVWTLSHPGDWAIRTSVKAPPWAGLFAETVRQSDNYIFWATYRPPLRWGVKQPLSVGVGHSARRGPDGVTPVREVHFGIGTTLPDVVRTFAPHAARYLGILDFYYFNLNLTATVK